MTSLNGTDPARAALASTRHCVVTADGLELPLTRFVGETTRPFPVLLTHGTFSNGRICGRLAGYLAEHGFDCWVLELRGHGRSKVGPVHPDFEQFSEFDAPAALRAVRQHTQNK